VKILQGREARRAKGGSWPATAASACGLLWKRCLITPPRAEPLRTGRDGRHPLIDFDSLQSSVESEEDKKTKRGKGQPEEKVLARGHRAAQSGHKKIASSVRVGVNAKGARGNAPTPPIRRLPIGFVRVGNSFSRWKCFPGADAVRFSSISSEAPPQYPQRLSHDRRDAACCHDDAFLSVCRRGFDSRGCPRNPRCTRSASARSARLPSAKPVLNRAKIQYG